jgi:L-ascorbate metabolism protein UlaG (beta-lactamase superfamily)
MRLTWYSHSCFLLETAAHRLLFDPWLDTNPAAPLRAAEVRCDVILCSHAHEDHSADVLPIARANRATVVAPYELANYFAARGATTIDLMQGGAISLPFGRVKLTPAIHSSALEQPDGRNLPLGSAAGFLVTAEGRTLYHAGDTALFGDMRFITRGGLDVALLPIGDRYTMGIEDALLALDLLCPRLTIPMHYDTHADIRVDAADFAKRAASIGHTVKLLRPGESVTL